MPSSKHKCFHYIHLISVCVTRIVLLHGTWVAFIIAAKLIYGSKTFRLYTVLYNYFIKSINLSCKIRKNSILFLFASKTIPVTVPSSIRFYYGFRTWRDYYNSLQDTFPKTPSENMAYTLKTHVIGFVSLRGLRWFQAENRQILYTDICVTWMPKKIWFLSVSFPAYLLLKSIHRFWIESTIDYVIIMVVSFIFA